MTSAEDWKASAITRIRIHKRLTQVGNLTRPLSHLLLMRESLLVKSITTYSLLLITALIGEVFIIEVKIFDRPALALHMCGVTALLLMAYMLCWQ